MTVPTTDADVAQQAASARRTRYAVCGLSNRGLSLFVGPLLGLGKAGGESGGDAGSGADMSRYGELVAIVDIDPARVARFNELTGAGVPSYLPDDFDRMVDETAPEVVLVTSPDYTHADYVTAALARDLDVITEKPMAASCAQVQAILEAERRSRGSVRVAHNLRYTPRTRQLKRMMLDGLVGRVTSVDLTWSVDTFHGSSYFHRWNRRRAWSGGLSIHKACHHFDMVTWLLDDTPEQVFAYGALNFYGPESPHNPANRDGAADADRGDGAEPSARAQRQQCPYHLRWLADGEVPDDDHLKPRSGLHGLPYDVQYPPGEQNWIYDPEIDIEDTYSAVVRYRRGASLSYSVTFSGAWEGYRLAINGTHGRIEACSVDFRDGRGETAESAEILYYPMFGPRQRHDVVTGRGSHGGADPLIRRDLLLGPSQESRDLRIMADSRQGAVAVAMGEAVWRSVADNRPYSIDELLGDVRSP
ncbi:Gfo/Idh/MocA family oxidoreductase [Actinopolymorpha pittospori]|uniref:Dehydrogenase n=1 Tax=Actinopolymorpha pittospori TaxID=648752 RepID=A0A927MW54_9ACTN|nr:Gfo/Idh/MocA family oxidoreductase [Actinopolymorpha pittospori]MBE1607372.1 putative dehydrogenase [Actinopolymorpha pittospori]